MKPDLHAISTAENPASAAGKAITEIAAIWKEVLGLPDIDLYQPFFSLGGNSINAIAVMSKMKKAGYPVTLRDIIHHQSIRKIVDEVLQPSTSPLIATAEALESFVLQEGGIAVTFRNVQVQYPHGIREYQILQTEAGQTAAVQQLISNPALPVAAGILPHYISDKTEFNETTGAPLPAAIFQALLGLQPLELFDAPAAAANILATYQANDTAIRKPVILRQYPLCAMQQLQISFHTQACVDLLPLHTHVDVPLLQQVYSTLIKRHSLLRSVAVKGEHFHNWEEHAFDPALVPEIPVIDLSGYQYPEADFYPLVTSFVFRKYDPGKIFHQLVLFRVNLKEYYLVMIFSHVIFDRVTGEVLKSQLQQYYQDLADKRRIREEKIVPFESYVRAIEKGPQQLSTADIIRNFQLEDFYNAKQRILETVHGRESAQSYAFSITVSLQDTVQDPLATTLAIYTRALHRYLGVSQLPLLFVCDGRQYENKLYYNTVGEFTDMVPMLTDAAWTVKETGDIISGRLAALKQHNLNFLHLLLHPSSRADKPEISRLMDAGEALERFDILMFNFLGNAEEVPVTTDEQTDIQPNPLPIYSLLNCIASSGPGSITFRFRSSYTIDIDALRKIFAAVVPEM
ncbi:phosphopantetheine-binding protein [Chitinophaga solisilvae]|uniref:phosphopantetheine-binding protein n=1 Tax=Chitinophaga solisilvae TaxID=1233460 RepID=UPI00136B127E|nr:phosphopantetheine-binding protein [Chitinophaga solisilvae]